MQKLSKINNAFPFILSTLFLSISVFLSPAYAQQNTCTPSCVDECTPSGTIACQTASQEKTCGNYDSDHCLEWGNFIQCTSGFACQSAQGCMPTCQDECTPSGTTACDTTTSTKTCGNFDQDCCLDWSTPTTCQQAQICQSGQCIQDQQQESRCETPQNGFCENFDAATLNTNIWSIASYNSNGYKPGQHLGLFRPSAVTVNSGFLVLKLTQEFGQVDSNPSGIISTGGQVSTNQKFGYGTYEYRLRMSSTSQTPAGPGEPKSGSVSTAYTLVGTSQTELDVEVEGQFPNQLELVTWNNPDPSRPAKNPEDREYTFVNVPNMEEGFKIYKVVWTPASTKYFVDNQLVATHTNYKPTQAAHLFLSHWGTDSTAFGGPATPNINRYFYIDWVKFTPPVCGNAVVEGTETCDDGANNGACPKTCSSTCATNSCQTLNCETNFDGCSPSGFIACFDDTRQMTCGNYRGDACTEWGDVKQCNTGFVCKTGQGCVNPNAPSPTSLPIPGTIQAEDYNQGGEGVAYHDTTQGNSGASYRTDNVDIEPASQGGFNIGWIAAGEWTKYNVNVQTTKNYNIELRVARQPTASKTMHMKIDGVAITSPITIPSTGGWQTWTSVFVSNIPLTQGNHVLTLFYDQDSFNVDWVKFT